MSTINPATTSIVSTNLEDHGFKLLARGKVRDVYEIDSKTLLFVATDRISAYDVIMKNVSAVISQSSFSYQAFPLITFFFLLNNFLKCLLLCFPAFMLWGTPQIPSQLYLHVYSPYSHVFTFASCLSPSHSRSSLLGPHHQSVGKPSFLACNKAMVNV